VSVRGVRKRLREGQHERNKHDDRRDLRHGERRH